MTVLELAKTAFFAASTVAVLAFGYETITVGENVKKSSDAYASVPAKINLTLDWLNRPGTGTLASLDKVILTTKSLEVHADLAIAHEDKQLATLDRQEAALFDDLHTTLSDARGTIAATTEAVKSTNAAMNALQPILVNSASVTEDADVTVKHLDALIASPDIAATLGNVNGMTENGNRILKDGADEADKLVHPPKVKLGFWGAVWLVTQKIHSALPPLF